MTPSSPSPDAGPEMDPVTALTQGDVVVLELSPNGEILSASEALESLTGFSTDFARGSAITDFVPATPPVLDQLAGEGTVPETPLRCTLPFKTADGGLRSCELYLANADPSSQSTPTTLTGTLAPTPTETFHPQPGDKPPERVSEEDAPAKAFVALADALQEGIIVLDASSQIQYANPAVERILGYSPDELVGGSKLSIIPDRLEQTHLNALNNYLETGERNIDWEYVELPGQHKDGHEIPLGISLNDFTFNGQTYFVGLFRDISQRKEAEQKIRAREQELTHYKEYTDDILDAIDDVFYVLDSDGNLLRWNHTLCEVTGYSPAEVESMNARDFFDEETRQSIEGAVEEGFGQGTTRVTATLSTKDGQRIPHEFVASTLETPDGETVLTGIGRDIAKQKEYEEQLEESNKRLEQFAYAASHDLQEPLRMITSYLQLLESRYDDALDEDGEEFLEFAVDGANRMREMIDGLLEYSRVETRGDPFEPVNLNCVLSDIRDDLQLRIRETNASVTVEEIPPVRGDPSQLYQVLQNLLENALKYRGDVDPAIHIDAEQHNETITVSVHDNGIGIPEDSQERIFTVFDRLHSREEYDGAGIGLALCRRIIERHDGDIWVDSEPGEGSTFAFTLPAAE